MSGDTPTVEGALVSLSLVARRVRRPITTDGGGQHTATQAIMVVESEMARLRAEVDAMEQTNAELLAGSVRKSLEIERLTPDTPGHVSDHVRNRITEAGRAALDAKGGCIAAACIPAHQAAEVLDAHDDARAEVKRLGAQLKTEGAVRARAQAEAERLTRERDAANGDAREWCELRNAARAKLVESQREAALPRERAETTERERDESRARLGDVIGWATRAHKSKDWSTYAVLEGLLSRLRSLYPEDSTTDETGGDQ